MEIRHFFPDGQVERGTGKPGYRWVPAYAHITANGWTMPLTRHEWQELARRDGFRCKFHAGKREAKAAFDAQQSAD